MFLEYSDSSRDKLQKGELQLRGISIGMLEKQKKKQIKKNYNASQEYLITCEIGSTLSSFREFSEYSKKILIGSRCP